MRRRTFVRGVGGGSMLAVAGCLEREDEDDEPEEAQPEDENTLRVVTYSSMVTGETPAGAVLAEAFEEELPDAEIEWIVPEAGIEHYAQRARLEAEMNADVYLGLTPAELVFLDEAVSADVFERLERERLERDGRIRADLSFGDPDDRALPIDSGYVGLVYDESVLEAPETFEDLLAEEYAGTVLAQDPRRSAPGRAFLLSTVAAYGNEFVDYWEGLRENDVDVYERWTDSYVDEYLEETRPMVVSYTTDRIAANAADRSMERHQIATPDGQGYENVEGVAVFADTGRRELAYEFVDFLLSSQIQTEIAIRNAQFPALERQYLDLGTEFTAFARQPEQPVRFTYDELHGNLTGWLEEWGEEFGEDVIDDRPEIDDTGTD
ncbi:thiamine ABC transporter substrate-binding protein [Natrarchaeobius chitinivorans]|uniref:Thiamine ABC transporter substrate-binding protein n=1 Tax=Natrarchaeobius chitinivorans TaxID=1679083 RepID=A0A3N6MKB0_NATCH|nr:thiamine ABC transporter substrate-binding protein [Natrarchaeobius chitinivorans]RQG94696.1 thiamine ABC transporter substrate-binding protein [Natrarchaeobius chitinivorans]